ncbi:MAG TPA: glucose-6-phosphate isomerase [Thermopetrobacter sp.]|nr:glucose-6-phosphate isomerase [Thermopetrobacter sp.]
MTIPPSVGDLPYEQDLTGCLENIPEKTFDTALNNVATALDGLRREYRNGGLPHLDVPLNDDDLEELRDVAARLSDDSRHIMVFGTGGSSLGGQALQQIAQLVRSRKGQQRPQGPELHFLDNLESPWVDRRLMQMDPAATRFLVISKSGNTAETVTKTIMAIEFMKRAGLEDEITRRMVIVTEDAAGDNALRRLAADFGLRVVEHPKDIGGRYSVLTVVGMLPAILLGLDPKKIRAGAAEVVRQVLNGDAPQRIAPAAGAAMQCALIAHRHIAAMITMPYTSRLRLFAAWLQQLWAESLGKEGFGTLPVTAVGPVDQHSQLQLYMDGPNDKLFNLIHIARSPESFRIPEQYTAYNKDLAGLQVSDLTSAQQQGTTQALLNRGRFVRVFHLSNVSERPIGALFMHFMIETILVARMRRIDPFNQPAVEELKDWTRRFLPQR